MKIALAVITLVAIALGWQVISMNGTIRQQAEQIQALADKSKERDFALQSQCATNAHTFLISRGWTPGESSDYQNHFNPRLDKCFVLASEYSLRDDFRSLDLYDAVEGRRYATYNGHDICEVDITKNPRKCRGDSGSIWFDGDDSRHPADFTVGFRGMLYGGGAGDENTQKSFRNRVNQFISQ